MATRGEASVRLISAGVLAIVAGLAFGLRTLGGGPAGVEVPMAVAGLVIVVVRVIPRFRSDATYPR